jgi:hypothetical protein
MSPIHYHTDHSRLMLLISLIRLFRLFILILVSFFSYPNLSLSCARLFYSSCSSTKCTPFLFTRALFIASLIKSGAMLFFSLYSLIVSSKMGIKCCLSASDVSSSTFVFDSSFMVLNSLRIELLISWTCLSRVWAKREHSL